MATSYQIIIRRGVAWSSGQHRSLSLQGSADRIPVVPLSFIRERERTYRQQTGVKKCDAGIARRKAESGSGDEEERPAGVSGMDLREWFGSFRRRLNG